MSENDSARRYCKSSARFFPLVFYHLILIFCLPHSSHRPHSFDWKSCILCAQCELCGKQKTKKALPHSARLLKMDFKIPWTILRFSEQACLKRRPTTSTGVRYANSSVFDFDCNRCAHIAARNLVTIIIVSIVWLTDCFDYATGVESIELIVTIKESNSIGFRAGVSNCDPPLIPSFVTTLSRHNPMRNSYTEGASTQGWPFFVAHWEC